MHGQLLRHVKYEFVFSIDVVLLINLPRLRACGFWTLARLDAGSRDHPALLGAGCRGRGALLEAGGGLIRAA